ncbi:bifunctional adenosylcobinamide kinase/adenosylcobinamide-phosphate guanylyltransferase [Myxococcota bacterium]|nr:bifunctional adenosylcobinamide kinase/adenosylcobinamide-phosphate guanylyltransferase [Myxococcota bacterium]
MGIVLVTGGVRSGKSARALELAGGAPAPRAFVATAEPMDGEMAARIHRHRAEREGRYDTLEEPLDLGGALRAALGRGARTVIVDCLTVWLGNAFCRPDLAPPSRARLEDDLLAALVEARDSGVDVVVVTNEVGLGTIGPDALTRAYVDGLGRLNRRVAAVADRVELVVCGIPLPVKPG